MNEQQRAQIGTDAQVSRRRFCARFICVPMCTVKLSSSHNASDVVLMASSAETDGDMASCACVA